MSWSAPAFGELAELLSRSVGLDFPDTRVSFAELGMRRAMTRARERDAGAFARRVVREPALFQALVAEVVIGETYFFRDAAQFEMIRTRVLPEIAARRTDEPLHVWSAGCASGEEAYSLAILVEGCGLAERSRIVATDVSAAAIASASRGRYPERSFRGDVGPWRACCFTPGGSAWTIDPRFRERIAFAVHNVAADEPGEIGGVRAFDLIVCRNVLIYFEPAALERALRALTGRLAPGGWLFTSPTDPFAPARFGLEIVETEAGLAYRRPLPDRPRPIAVPPCPSHTARPRSGVVASLPAARPIDPTAADAYLADALRLLDEGQPVEALASARRARYLDRSSPVAHLALGRAFRLCGRIDAARRSLRRSRVLLATHAADAPVRGADGASAGALSAVVTAELALLTRRSGEMR